MPKAKTFKIPAVVKKLPVEYVSPLQSYFDKLALKERDRNAIKLKNNAQ